MANETVKRWSVLGGLLAITLWLVSTAPEENDNYDVVEVNVSRSANKVKSDNTLTIGEDNSEADEIKLAKRTLMAEKPFDIFGTYKVPVIKKVTPKIKKQPQIKTAVAAPRAPRIPFRYIGQISEKGRVKLFLMEGEALHLVSKGDMIGETYKVTEVNADEISLLYLPLDITQLMSIGRTP